MSFGVRPRRTKSIDFNTRALPTDNLYKFLCILGLAIVVIACFMYWQHYVGVRDSLARCKIELDRLRMDADRLGRYVDRMKSEVDRAKNDPKAIPKLKEPPILRSNGIEVSEELQLAMSRAVDALYVSRILLVVGACLMVGGIWLWYTRVQVFEDQVLRERAKMTGTNQRMDSDK